MIPVDAGRILLPLARAAIAERLCLATPVGPESPPWLADRGATFVTLRRSDRLRGCIGTIEAYRPLAEDVRGNACAAAFHDLRFPALAPGEYAEITIEVSVLSVPEPMPWSSEAEVLRGVRPGVDGIVLQAGRHRGTFLPQVWEGLPDPRDFLAQLRIKAGLTRRRWGPDWRVSRYTVSHWSEQ